MAKMTAELMAQLFDVDDISSNLDENSASDYGSESVPVTHETFESKCANIKETMEHESPPPVKETLPVKETVIKEPAKTEVTVKESRKTAPNKKDTTEVVKTETVQASSSVSSDNPLELSAEDLRAYKQISEKYPNFRLCDGSVGFKDFYRTKVQVLKSILSSFPLLPIAELMTEVRSTRVNHQIGEDVANPETIRRKLDDSYAYRTRLTTILAKALEQYPVWKKSAEMLSSKLWKEHESKGAHRRLSLNLEHMFDIELYVDKLKGLIDSASLIDDLLKSSSDSLSRQLSCVMTKEHIGMSSDAERPKTSYRRTEDASDHSSSPEAKRHTELDHLDTLDTSATVGTQDEIIENDFGVKTSDDDFTSDIG